MGVAGSGKSTVGAVLARRLGVPFAEGDDFHPAANVARMRAGVPLDDTDRAPWLDAVAGWLAAHRDGGVVSCSALRLRYRDRLRLAAPEVFFLHLHGTPQTLAARLGDRGGHFMPAALLRSQLETLEALTPGEAGAVVDVGGTPQDVAAQALAALPDQPPAASP
ncbi:gluconokinase [Streptomyces sp. SL13]|uniref:Gluconokinase n=1 Tax=Streptantibioticus silvisoli TaxID=2705255 RepID=A0AA90H659_9ACTN|nr:gluconokinase [Streptantibioticus silvisoli]MDI5971620.1 gluconokinase [Streptantibioticus silvisoli]